MPAKIVNLTADERDLFQKQVSFYKKGEKHYARIKDQLLPDDYKTIDRILGFMHAKWDTKEKVHIFKIGYNPEEMTRSIKNGFLLIERDGFFSTPKGLCVKVVDAAQIKPGMTFLEPSAGIGAIADEITARGIAPNQIDVCEMNPSRQKVLTDKGFNLVGADFLQFFGKTYDRIILNPPFENGIDSTHILKAVKMLNVGGILVAICGSQINWMTSKPYGVLRAISSCIEEIPKGTFSSSGTGVETAMIIIHKNSDFDFDKVVPVGPKEKEVEIADPVQYEDPKVLVQQIMADLQQSIAILSDLQNELSGSMDGLQKNEQLCLAEKHEPVPLSSLIQLDLFQTIISNN